MTTGPADGAGGTGKVDVATLFPSSVSVSRRRRAIRRRARAGAIAVVVLAVALAGVVVAMRASASGPAQYRTMAAAQRNVDALLHGVATIEPVTQAAVAFPVSGTVASVAVTPGATVAAGQPLAALDTASLQAALDNQQAALDQANLTLQKALAGQSVPAPGATTRSFTMGAPVKATLYGGLSNALPDDIAAAQQAVLAAQQQVDTARSHASAALASATNVCAAIGVNPADPSGAVAALNACQTALQDVATAQTAVNDAQTALAAASTNLDHLLDQLATQPPPTTTTEPPTTQPPTTTTAPPTTAPPTTTPAPPSTGPAPATTAPVTATTGPARGPSSSTPPSSAPADTTTTTTPKTSGARSGGGGLGGGSSGGSSRSSGSGSASAAKPSAADLVAYQSAVDAATANVTMAQQALAQATIVSPIDGTVVAVNLTPGTSASAGSTTQTIVVAGNGGFEAATTISLADVPSVKVGQAASVIADGASTPVNGQVVSISPVPASSTSTNYRVMIGLPADASGLLNGAIGSVTIVTGTAAGVGVPTSAVTTTGAIHTVRVLEGTTVRTVAVQVGVVGDTWTQVTSGLLAGQQVVLAAVDEPLPDSATSGSSGNPTNGQNTVNFPFGRIQRGNG
jgi:HlyD family secretion protein